MALVFTPDTSQQPGTAHALGDVMLLAGTLVASGSYATGGDTFGTKLDPESLFGRVGRGKVSHIDLGSGYGGAWDATNKKLLIFVSGGTQLTAAAYPATLTTGVTIMIYGR